MTEKRYNVWDIDGTIFLEDHKEGSYHIGQVGNVDINCLNDIAKLLNDLTDENEQLKQREETLLCEIKDFQELLAKNDGVCHKRVIDLIDNKIDEFKNGGYGDLPCNTIHMFLDLKEEIGDGE